MILLMEELSAANLSEHLSDPTFVEYFNAFLLLSAFNHRAFYNAELGLFEEVAVPRKTSMEESVPQVVSPTSSCSLIVTDDNVIATLDKQQSWLWVVKERLPLFIRSDLYSQYKLCKILSSPPAKLVSVAAFPKKASTLSPGHQRHSYPGCPEYSFEKRSAAVENSRSSMPTILSENRELDYSLLNSKVAMGQFCRFLRGTVGEKYWFFWLDVERARYLNKSVDQHRLLRELRDKYLKAGGNFELPAETRKKMGVFRLSKLSMDHLDIIQSVLTETLKNYWCARFLLHYKNHAEEYSSHIRPQTCYAHPLEQGPMKQFTSSHTKLHSAASRLTPTPHSHNKNAFELISLKSQSASPSSDKQTLLPDVSGKQAKKTTSVSDTRLTKKEIPEASTAVRATVSDQLLASAKLPSSTAHLPNSKPAADHQKVPSHTNRTLRYMVHHFPQVSSRESSVMSMRSTTDSTLFSTSLVADSSCQILSVSGTPLPIASNVEEESEYKALLKFLSIEQRKAGGVFQRYLEDKKDEHSLNCLMFWRELQTFKKLFTQTRFNPCSVDMMARGIHAKFIAEVGDYNINCDVNVRQSITTMLDPPYEDLFDLAEEHALKCLLTPWIEMSNDDSDMFRKMERVQSSRRRSALSKPQSRGGLHNLSEESFLSDDDLLEDESLYDLPDDASHLLAGPTQKPLSLREILQNRIELDHFKIFLNEQFAAQDLMCWMEIEHFRGMPIAEKKLKDNKARQIRKQFFNRQYFFGPQSPANKQQQLQVCCAGGGVYGQRLSPRPSSAVLIEAQKHVKARLEKKWLPMFLETPEYKQRHLTRHGGRKTSVHSPTGNKSGELNWMTNSLDAILFRRALQDHLTCANFVQYLGIKEEPNQFLVNNVLFWLEVQRFKEMYHAHTMMNMLQNKMQAIINCFLLSPVPPKLQLNIPQEIADKVTKKEQIGPYVFREAQASVFRDLFSYWTPFQNFSAGHNPNHLPFKELAAETKERRESMLKKEAAYEQYLTSKRQGIPRFETEAEKQKRLKEEANAKEMANVAIAFKLSEPSPLYETVIPRENADPDNTTTITPEVVYTDKKAAETKSNSQSSKLFKPPFARVSSTLRPQTGKLIKKSIEIVHARPTTSLAKKTDKIFPSVTSTAKQDTNSKTPTTVFTKKQITGNKINFETHVEETEAEKFTKPKSKRLVKMQFSSNSSNFRYADGLERSPSIKLISSMNT